MSERPAAGPAGTTTTEDGVRLLAEIAGLDLTVERLSIVAAQLAELRAMAVELRAVDVEGVDPDVAFDARWPGGSVE